MPLQGTAGGGDDELVSGLVLQANPVYLCYTGDHRAVGAMAWLVLILHVIGFPLATFAYLWRAVPNAEVCSVH